MCILIMRTIIYPLMSLGILPRDWKLGHVTPIYKNKGSKSDPKNYCLIIIISSIRKVLKITISVNLIDFLLQIKLIHISVNLIFYYITLPVTNLCFCFINVLILSLLKNILQQCFLIWPLSSTVYHTL